MILTTHTAHANQAIVSDPLAVKRSNVKLTEHDVFVILAEIDSAALAIAAAFDQAPPATQAALVRLGISLASLRSSLLSIQRRAIAKEDGRIVGWCEKKKWQHSIGGSDIVTINPSDLVYPSANNQPILSALMS